MKCKQIESLDSGPIPKISHYILASILKSKKFEIWTILDWSILVKSPSVIAQVYINMCNRIQLQVTSVFLAVQYKMGQAQIVTRATQLPINDVSQVSAHSLQ